MKLTLTLIVLISIVLIARFISGLIYADPNMKQIYGSRYKTMSKNILIPMDLLSRIVELLEYLDVSNYDRVIQDDYCDVLRALMVKMQKIELRDAYSNIINAKNTYDRDWARIEYLRLKSQLGIVDVGY